MRERLFERRACVDFIFLARNKRAFIEQQIESYAGSVLRMVVCVASYYLKPENMASKLWPHVRVFVNEILYIVYGCFLTTKAELSSSDRDCMFHKD